MSVTTLTPKAGAGKNVGFTVSEAGKSYAEELNKKARSPSGLTTGEEAAHVTGNTTNASEISVGFSPTLKLVEGERALQVTFFTYISFILNHSGVLSANVFAKGKQAGTTFAAASPFQPGWFEMKYPATPTPEFLKVKELNELEFSLSSFPELGGGESQNVVVYAVYALLETELVAVEKQAGLVI